MLSNIATVLAALIGAGAIFMGTLPFWAPQAAVGFGIPDTPTENRTFHAWLSVKGVRDIASGLFIFILLVGGTTHLRFRGGGSGLFAARPITPVAMPRRRRAAMCCIRAGWSWPGCC